MEVMVQFSSLQNHIVAEEYQQWEIDSLPLDIAEPQALSCNIARERTKMIHIEADTHMFDSCQV